jgi:hypothetical protein
MHPLLRAVWAMAGLLLLGAGILFGVLGFWGVSRRGEGAGWLAALGTSAALAGGVLVLKACKGTF